MSNTHRFISFGALAFRWSREPGVQYSDDDLLKLLSPAFWRGEFDDGELGWDVNGAMPELFEAEDRAREGKKYAHERNIQDFEPLPNGRERQYVHQLLHTLGSETAIANNNPTDGSAFDELAQTPWDCFEERERVVLRHIMVSALALLCWFEANKLKPLPTFLVASKSGEINPPENGGGHERPSDSPPPIGPKPATREKYQRWYDLAREVKVETKSSDRMVLARGVRRALEKERKPGGRRTKLPDVKSIHRRLNQWFPGWADGE